MNKIEEQTRKFLSIKQKLPSKDIDIFTTRSSHPYFSFLTYFYQKKTNTKHKNPFENKPNPNLNLTEKIGEPKQREKNIFISQKLNDKNKGKTTQGKNHGTEQTPNNRGNGNSDSSLNEINLLQIENTGMKRENITKMFAKQREEEKKMIIEEKNNQTNEAAKEEEKEENEDKDNLINKDEYSYDDDEKDKNNDDKDEEDKLKDNNFNNSNNLNLKKYESKITVPDYEFSIFDKTRINEEQYGENLFEGQNDSIEEKNRETFDKKDEIKEEKKIQDEKKEKTKEKPKEKKQLHEKEKEKEKETKRSNSKICIPLDEEEKKEEKEKEKEKNNKNSFLKPNQVTKNPKNNSDKKKNINNNINNNENLLQKKHNRISQSEARITSSSNKTEINSSNKKDNFISSHKPKSKIILDEDEEYTINAKNTKKNIAEIKKEEKPIMTNEGNKFIINFEANEKNNNDNDNEKENQAKEISINIESEPEIKNNKNIINKNKNVSNNSQKNNNSFNDYDISCVENIISILTQIRTKLNQEGKEKISIQNCFDLIKSIKSDENCTKRIKDTYINVFKLLRILFKIFSDNEISLNFNNEIIAIFIHVDNYYKKVKTNEKAIDTLPYYHKRKVALKYAFSKLELRNFEKQNYKELYINNNNKNKEEKDIQIKDNNKALRFIKLSKRYVRTSLTIYKEIKDFRDKIKNLPKTKSINSFLNKYENILSDIQSSPHFMKYNKLFSHFSLIFSFHVDSKNILKEIEEAKRKENNNINDERKKGKSMQLNKNGLYNKRESSMNNVKMKNNK